MPQRFFAYLIGLIRRRRVERETDAELQFHVEMEAEANRARGLSPDEARRAALRDLGGMTQTRESVRGLRLTWIDGAWQDLRYGLRSLRRSPAFSFVAILVLTLGIGVNTAAFSIVNALFFPKIAVQDPHPLVYLFQVGKYGQQQVTTTDDVKFFDGHYDKAFTAMTAHWGVSVALAANDETSLVFAETVLSNYFDVLGVKPVMGVGFRPEDDEPSNTNLSVVISHDLWARRFKSDPEIVGKQVRIEDRVISIVGVMGPEFVGLSEVWRPRRLWITATALFGAERFGMGVIGRLKPDVSLEQARAVVAGESALMQRERARSFRSRPDWKPAPYVVRPIADVPMPFSPSDRPIPPGLLAAMLTVVGIVLIIATTNITGVLAGRGLMRTGEVAVRQALGAGAPRLIRQMVVESLLLALSGGVIGLALSEIIVSLYSAYSPSRLVVDVPFDWRVGVFTLAVCIGTGLVIGITPALQAMRINVVSALGGGATSGTSPRGRRHLRHAILIPQVALSIALLVVAGVHARTLLSMERVDPGYRVDDVTVMRLGHWDQFRMYREVASTDWKNVAESSAKRAKRSREFYQAVLNSVGTVPIDGGVALTSGLPTYSWPTSTAFISEGALLSGNTDTSPAWLDEVSAGYFKTMGISIVQGRGFDERDTPARPGVAIISERLAQRLWPAGNAIGKRLAQYPPPMTNRPPDWKEVIGIAAETSSVLQKPGERPMVYTALSQSWQPSFQLVAWSRGDQTALIQQLKTAVVGADTFAEVRSVQSMREIVNEMLYPRRAAAWILVGSGVLGLLLASIGLYGVISHSVAQRLKELGIRTTLGANRGDILRLVLREAAAVALMGALPGLGLSLIALRLTSNLVGAVPTFDAVTFVVVPLLATAIVLAASYIPARRAARLDPMTILRAQ